MGALIWDQPQARPLLTLTLTCSSHVSYLLTQPCFLASVSMLTSMVCVFPEDV